MGKLIDWYKYNKFDGDVGIEIEVEGVNLPEVVPGWFKTHDNSLRGESGEYVTDSPVKAADVSARIASLTKAFKSNRGYIHDSVRAGVHVHLNVQDMTRTQLGCLFTMWYIVEDLATQWCGDTRAGNLFCLRASDADAIIPVMRAAFGSTTLEILHRSDVRYAALNPTPITTYGSVEFRCMRTDPDLKVVEQWVDIVLSLKKAALRFSNPTDIIQEFSMNTPQEFLEMVFGPFSRLMLFPDYETTIRDGMWRAQEIAFCCDWKAKEKLFSQTIKKYRLKRDAREADLEDVERMHPDGENDDRVVEEDNARPVFTIEW